MTSTQRAALAKAAAQAILLRAGFTDAAIHVARSGRTMTIVIPSRSACAAQPSDERKLSEMVRRSVPFVTRVSLVVSGTGTPLSRYLESRCRSPLSPGGRGKVVYNRSGRGTVNGPVFRIRSRHWSIDFRNNGSFLAIFVLEKGSIKGQPLAVRGRRAGSQAYPGPGRFRLRISGSGTWTVRVRDGA